VAFLDWVRRTRPRLFLPTLAMPEVAAALSRTGTEATLALQYARAICQLPGTAMVALDDGLAGQAAAFGAQHRLRGADAVFLATAALFAAELITLDHEQLARAGAIVQTLTPGDFMSAREP
jgi:predicted nucleic acid-binding protein